MNLQEIIPELSEPVILHIPYSAMTSSQIRDFFAKAITFLTQDIPEEPFNELLCLSNTILEITLEPIDGDHHYVDVTYTFPNGQPESYAGICENQTLIMGFINIQETFEKRPKTVERSARANELLARMKTASQTRPSSLPETPLTLSQRIAASKTVEHDLIPEPAVKPQTSLADRIMATKRSGTVKNSGERVIHEPPKSLVKERIIDEPPRSLVRETQRSPPTEEHRVRFTRTQSTDDRTTREPQRRRTTYSQRLEPNRNSVSRYTFGEFYNGLRGDIPRVFEDTVNRTIPNEPKFPEF
jgi:hypothetical protein